ncbi:hypothetical protein HPP92_027549 [Vanilla planifolia]|uniref:Mitochondrial import inner membrane translocase subunit Tim21 n=1 Tax=Vanilla planifolia TaxID=51239 RepID=A0A835P8J0_VANPL|nr:hypothetical protein HPP92_027549 [Vanilla planifolia]KAG0460722.1 hypothetical protein HPP92_021019 [Vanilla planifolia]
MRRLRIKTWESDYMSLYRAYFSAANALCWGFSSSGFPTQSTARFDPLKTIAVNPCKGGFYGSSTCRTLKDFMVAEGCLGRYENSTSSKQLNIPYTKLCMLPSFIRPFASNFSTQSSQQAKEESRKDISMIEDPFDDAPTYNIPEKPVTFVEGASYSVIILAGLGVASLAAYAVLKELIFEPKEYKIFGKALERVQNDSQVRVRIGSPVTGYGQESRNRAARQRIANRVWKDEDGIEHVEVNFFIRGPHGAGKVFAEMFKDSSDKNWKFTYLIVEIVSPTHTQLMLESYVPT